MPPLALAIDTCASYDLTVKHKKQNSNLFTIILLFNNMLLLCLCPTCKLLMPSFQGSHKCWLEIP